MSGEGEGVGVYQDECQSTPPGISMVREERGFTKMSVDQTPTPQNQHGWGGGRGFTKMSVDWPPPPQKSAWLRGGEGVYQDECGLTPPPQQSPWSGEGERRGEGVYQDECRLTPPTPPPPDSTLAKVILTSVTKLSVDRPPPPPESTLHDIPCGARVGHYMFKKWKASQPALRALIHQHQHTLYKIIITHWGLINSEWW